MRDRHNVPALRRYKRWFNAVSMRHWLAYAASGVLLASCSNISVVPETHDTLLKTELINGPGHDARFHASISKNDDAFTVTLMTSQTCAVHSERVLHRTRTLHRKVDDKSTLIIEYGLGAALLIAGAAVSVDAPNVPMNNDPLTTNPVGRTGAYGIGIGLLALGTTGAIAGVVDTRRARDSTEDLGEVTEPTNEPPHDISCNEGSAPNKPLTLRAAHGDVSFTTDATGKVSIQWNSIPTDWLNTANWTRIAKVTVDGVDVGELPLDRARARVASDLWSKAKAANSAAAYGDYLRNFPEAHHDEAAAAYRGLRVPELDAEIAAALDAKNLARAEAALEEWKTIDASSPAVNEASQRVADLKVDELLTTADKALSVANKDHLDELRDAQAAIQEAAGLAKPDDIRVAKRSKKLAQVTTTAIAGLVAESRAKANKGDFDGATATLDTAAKLDSDSKAIERARKTVDHLRQLAADREAALEARREATCQTKCRNGWGHLLVDYTKACLIDAAMQHGVDYAENEPGLPHECAVQALGLCTNKCLDGN